MQSAIQGAAGALFAYAAALPVVGAPLLEEEWGAAFEALVADGAHPVGAHWAGAGAAFAAGDHPVDAVEVELERAQQRLAGEELDCGGGVAQQGDARGPALVFDGDAHPDVVGPGQRGGELGEPLGALGEHLVAVLVRRLHHLEDLVDVVVGHVLVEEVAHGVDEDGARLRPAERLVEALGAQLQLEAALVGVAGDAAEALGEGFGVAVGAAGADLGAARDGVPGGVGPLDLRALH